jgi:hypothetical protein
MGTTFKPGVSNGAIINGVANFWQSSAPTTRINGALVDGDIWQSPGGRRTRLSGLWVSPELSIATLNTNNAELYIGYPEDSIGILLLKQVTSVRFQSGATLDANNYYRVGLSRAWNINTPTVIDNGVLFNDFVVSAVGISIREKALNYYFTRPPIIDNYTVVSSGDRLSRIVINTQSVGTLPVITSAHSYTYINYRFVYA